MRSHMTSDGSPYVRLQRAIGKGNLALIRATAAHSATSPCATRSGSCW
jgi:hypothetical protein